MGRKGISMNLLGESPVEAVQRISAERDEARKEREIIKLNNEREYEARRERENQLNRRIHVLISERDEWAKNTEEKLMMVKQLQSEVSRLTEKVEDLKVLYNDAVKEKEVLIVCDECGKELKITDRAWPSDDETAPDDFDLCYTVEPCSCISDTIRLMKELAEAREESKRLVNLIDELDNVCVDDDTYYRQAIEKKLYSHFNPKKEVSNDHS
jgi:hypothetical protein